MRLAEIPFDQSSFYSGFILDYLQESSRLKDFYRYSPNMDSFAGAMKERAFLPESRALLVDELMKQYAGLKLKPESLVYKNIVSLRDPNTFTVVTGHQLCLFTGPVYFIYKIVHAIRLADELKRMHPDTHVVPVYWMASEDHDFEEIRSFFVNDRSYTWEHEHTGRGVGTYDLEGIAAVFTELKQQYTGGIIPELVTIAEQCYASSSDLSEATFKLVHALFESYGLVIVEPNNRVFKGVLKEVMKADVFEQRSAKHLNQTNAELRKLRYPQQITGREINFFYLTENGRKLIFKEGSQYVIGEGVHYFSESELRTEIEMYPEKFSPNVVLRPVYQELLLPNLAYIGGPGEIAYWLQLKGVFDAYGISFPMLLLRNSFAVLSHSLRHKKEKLQLPDHFYFKKSDGIHVPVLHALMPTKEEQTATTIQQALQDLIDEVGAFDNRLASMLIEHKKQNSVFFSTFGHKLRQSKAAIEKHKLEQFNQIRHSLFSDTVPAERVNNILHYVKQNDHQEFIRMIYEHSASVTTGVVLMAY